MDKIDTALIISQIETTPKKATGSIKPQPAATPAAASETNEYGVADTTELDARKAALAKLYQAYEEVMQGKAEKNQEHKASHHTAETSGSAHVNSSASSSGDEEVDLVKLFGKKADDVAEVLKIHSELKAEDLVGFKDDPFFDDALDLLKLRADINFRELVVAKGGKEGLDGTLFLKDNYALLENREDMKPKDIREINAAIAQIFEPDQRKMALQMVSNLLLTRKDIKAKDMITLLKTVENTFSKRDRLMALGDTCILLSTRRDISAEQATQMMETVGKTIEDPSQRLAVFGKATELLVKRDDIQTQQVETMLTDFSKGVEDVGAGGSQDLNASKAKAKLFSDAADVLIARPDVKPEQMLSMFELCKRTVGKDQDQSRLQHLTGMFAKGCELLTKRPDIQPDQVEAIINQVQSQIFGHDGISNEIKFNMFSRVVNLLIENPNLTPQNVITMLVNASRKGKSNIEQQICLNQEISAYEEDKSQAIVEKPDPDFEPKLKTSTSDTGRKTDRIEDQDQ